MPGRWAALQSISRFSWSGSAILGGRATAAPAAALAGRSRDHVSWSGAALSRGHRNHRCGTRDGLR